jgi:hypothetical protein
MNGEELLRAHRDKFAKDRISLRGVMDGRERYVLVFQPMTNELLTADTRYRFTVNNDGDVCLVDKELGGVATLESNRARGAGNSISGRVERPGT